MTLELRGIHKHFGPIRANDGVDLIVESGTIHGLLGENGAGKSTLMKVLSGFISRDSGEVLLDGEPLELVEPREAIAAGIGMLHQDPLVFLPFSVLDNFLLGSPGTTYLDRSAGLDALTESADRYGFEFDPNAPIRTLTVGERQQLEICRLLWQGVDVLILDEPTTGISAAQRGTLFQTLRRLARDGMSVIFVSHKLEEIEEICDRATVMRLGKVVGSVQMPYPPERLVEMMFGHGVVESRRSDLPPGEATMTLDSVTAKERHLEMPNLSLTIRAGEVIGLAGLEGSGQRILLQTCTGLLKPDAGEILLDGQPTAGMSYRQFQSAGVHYLPAGRLEEGLMEGLTVSEHLELVRAAESFTVDWNEADRSAQQKIDRFTIKGTPDSPVESLSGGNQQRLLLAMVPDETRLLLMEHPTRGLDISSADWVWGQILSRREHGTAIMFASSDLDELLAYGDRILVFFAGTALAEVTASETNVDELGHLIGGRTRT